MCQSGNFGINRFKKVFRGGLLSPRQTFLRAQYEKGICINYGIMYNWSF